MKTTLTAISLLIGLTSAAASKEVYRNEDGDVAVRGSPCNLSVLVHGVWQSAPGACSMFKSGSSNNTIVWIGQGRMLIKRDPDERGFAKLYRIIPVTDELGFLGNAVADGPCWVGKGVRFCGK